jgi:hypothetical protein
MSPRQIVLMVVVLACLIIPSSSQAYMHVDNCWQGLRNGGPGDRDHDDDIHRYGVATGALYALRNTNGYHFADDRAVVYIRFWYAGNQYFDRPGYCAGGDSSFIDNTPFPTPGW